MAFFESAAPPPAKADIYFTAHAVSQFCMGLIAVLAAGHAAAMWVSHGLGYDTAGGFVPFFHLDFERNLPSSASGLLLASCGLLAGLTPGLQPSRAVQSWPWYLIAAVFLFLALDEMASIHESFSTPVRALLHADWVPMFAWVIPYVLGLGVLGVCVLRWYLQIDRWTQVRFLLAAVIFLTGAVGMELVSSAYYESLDPGRSAFRTPMGDALATIEELMELAGVSIFLHALVARLGGVHISRDS